MILTGKNFKNIHSWYFLGDLNVEDPSDLFRFIAYNPDTEDRRRFLCTICQKTSARNDDLRDHIENVHFPNVFPYSCSICELKVKSKVMLKTHMRTCRN